METITNNGNETTTAATNGATVSIRKKPVTRSYKTELKKAQAKEKRIILIAMLGWALFVTTVVVVLVVQLSEI